jgi:hypothetical protein
VLQAEKGMAGSVWLLGRPGGTGPLRAVPAFELAISQPTCLAAAWRLAPPSPPLTGRLG